MNINTSGLENTRPRRTRAVAAIAAAALGTLGLTAVPAVAADFSTTTAVTCGAGTAYTGLPQDVCTYTVVGSDSTVLDDGSGGLLTYDDNVNAGTVTATVNYGGDLAGTPSYDASSGSDTFTIDKADATVVVAPYTGPAATYDGSEFTAAVMSISGENGESDATVGTVDVSNTAHTDAGTYAADTWSFTGTANYNDIGATTITDSIDKADAVIVVDNYSVNYDGTAHEATYTVTGTEEGGGATGTTMDVSGTSHTDAGTYNGDAWSFDGGTNYNDQSGTVDDSIATIDATITCTGYTVTYNGSEHTATCSAGGVDGEGAADGTSFDVSGTAHTDAGTYNGDAWSFDGGTNYNDASGTVDDVINTATVGGGTYTGAIAVPAGARFTLNSSFTMPEGCSTNAYKYEFTNDSGSTWPWFTSTGYALRTIYTSDVLTSGLPAGAYDVRASYLGDENCGSASSDTPGFVVYDASTAAYGGGQYVNNGRANFAFEYHAKNALRAAGGNVVWNWKGQWRFKGKLAAYGKKTSGTLGGKPCSQTNPCGALSGSGSLFYFNGATWVSVGNNIVVNVSAIQNTPTTKNTTAGWIGFVFGYTPTVGQPALPSNTLIALQKSNNGGGGIISLK